MFDATLARRGRRHIPGLGQGRPKGRHLRGNDRAKPDVGCASGPAVRVPESRNRLSMTSTEIEENEMSHTAPGPAVKKDGEALARPFGNTSCRGPLPRTSMTRAKGNQTPSCWPTASSRRNSAGRPDHWRSGSGRAVEAPFLLYRSGGSDRRALWRDDIATKVKSARGFGRTDSSRFVEMFTGSASRLSGNSPMPVRN